MTNFAFTIGQTILNDKFTVLQITKISEGTYPNKDIKFEFYAIGKRGRIVFGYVFASGRYMIEKGNYSDWYNGKEGYFVKSLVNDSYVTEEYKEEKTEDQKVVDSFENIQLDGFNSNDSTDLSGVYVSSAQINNRPATESELLRLTFIIHSDSLIMDKLTKSKDLKISDFKYISIGGIDPIDYPDYADAYADYAQINGREATDEELYILSDLLQEDRDILEDIISDQLSRYADCFI